MMRVCSFGCKRGMNMASVSKFDHGHTPCHHIGFRHKLAGQANEQSGAAVAQAEMGPLPPPPSPPFSLSLHRSIVSTQRSGSRQLTGLSGCMRNVN